MIRNVVVRLLYVAGEACLLVAEQLSPATDEVWRDRRWKQFLRNESRLDSYTLADVPPNVSYRQLQRRLRRLRLRVKACRHEQDESPRRIRADDE